MITFVEGSFTYSLLLGMLAAVNPCGFVLLPTYLVAYLSVSDDTDVATRLRRSLVVGGSVSAGFLVVFLIVGAISRLFTNWIEINAKYASLVVGLALIVMGVRMLSGWRPRIWVPALSGESRRNGVVGMFAFGVVYAIASIGCTIGLLTTAILGSFTRDGLVSGVLSVVMYGFGMALFVTALTTTLAFAKTALVRGGRGVMSVVSYVSSGLVLITGIYLAWYWYVAITEQSDQGDILRALGNWQTTIVNRISDIGALPVAVACGIVVALAWFAARRRTSFSDS
ncbi:MAG: cytochrome c biogenesis CcdA family protein [Ilumatobacteraceae bacterium]